MYPLLQKTFLFALINLSGFFGTVQQVQAQSSLHDSLRHLLSYFGDSSKDEQLKQAVKEAQALYTSNRIDDSLAAKLVNVEDLIINDNQLNRQRVFFTYVQMLVPLLKQLPPQGEHLSYATALNNLANLYQLMGQYEKALSLSKQTANIRKKVLGEGHLDYSVALNNLAVLYRNMAQYEKALPLSKQTTAIRKKELGEEHSDYATALNNLARLYQNMGQYEKALPLFEQAAAIWKKKSGEEHLDYSTALNNLASLYVSMGKYEKALPLFEQTVAICKKTPGEEHLDYSIALNNLAALYVSMGKYEKALPLFKQTVAIRKKVLTEEHPTYATALNNLALLYYYMGQYEKALPLFEQAANIWKKTLGDEHPLYATALNNLALLYQDMGQQYEKALPLYKQAAAIRKKALGEEHPDYAGSLTSLALLYNNLGKPADASPLLIQASNIKLKYLTRTYGALSEQEKMTLLNKEVAQFSYLPSSLFTQSIDQPAIVQQVYAYELALKGMVLEDQRSVLSSIRSNKDSAALHLYEQWRTNKAILGKQMLLTIRQRMPYLDSLEEATGKIEQQLSRSSIPFHIQQQSQNITTKDIGQKLKEGEAAVEFIRFKLYDKRRTDTVAYAALMLLPDDTLPRFVPLFEEKQLQHLLNRSATAGPNFLAVDRLYGHGGKALGDSLYRLVWQPLEQHLTGVNTIYYAPAGLLHRIAFPALGADSAHLLLDKYRLNQVLSTRSVAVPAVVTGKPKTASVWGNIQYSASADYSITGSKNRGQISTEADTALSAFTLYNEDTRGLREGTNWEPLSFTKAEMDSLRKLFTRAKIPVITLSSTTATEEAFKALDGNSPRVLHLATHGFFLPVPERKLNGTTSGSNTFSVQENPMFRSGLVLAGGNRAWKGESALPGREDGILTAYEIAQMDLSNTNLVVLSACETALGDLQGNEGVIGMQRSFKLSGVKQMVVSLWKTNDKTTAELMTSFYKNWLNGQTTREALHNAQRQLKEKYKDPFYWAAFTLVE